MLTKVLNAISDANDRAREKQKEADKQALQNTLQEYSWYLHNGLYSAIKRIQIGNGVKTVNYMQDIHAYTSEAKYIKYSGVSSFQCPYGVLTDNIEINAPALEIYRDRINQSIYIVKRQFAETLNKLPEPDASARINNNLAIWYGFTVTEIKQVDDELRLLVIMPAF